MPPGSPTLPINRAESPRARVLMLVKRKEGISQADFRRHWSQVHAPMLLRMAEGEGKAPLKYHQMHINAQTNDILTWMGRETTEWDGVAMFEAESFGDIFAIFQSEQMRIAGVADEEEFMDRSRTQLIPLNFIPFIDK
ncbi:hypothetical protein CYLTODRAFT_485670 [Cylindrobasidium torrendii FP15055 ss-10]|uniref:EthD domain-containing protein n=1 Tax=Cylindrobasidium torrendii FP15055 ss-10 TaxID=1314674 RepID=A0A0D7BRT1_9AGAR|nr:hypothetical protein CYLTODRAFT_485670 [Cylindrobasidium torrendii FP15055 ss-10]